MELDTLIDRLAAFAPVPYPFISLYLDGRPDEHGKDRYEPFVRKALAEHADRFDLRTAERESFDRDAGRIQAWLATEARASANGIAIFACAGFQEFFEAVQLDVPIESHAIFVANVPRILPLAQLADRYRRYAAVVLDRSSARVFVFSLGETIVADAIEGEKTSRTDVGGWSQARYQRHVDNFTLQHVKEVVQALDELSRTEHIERVVLAGDEAVMPMLREQLPKHLEERMAEPIRLETGADDHVVRDRTLAVMRDAEARDRATRVARVLDAHAARGLGAAGVDEVREALVNGQVHELLISTTLDPNVAERLVVQARTTSALVTFIEDPALLEQAGGVAARLRYRIGGIAA
jgi:peptide chain release factor subunit 1